MVCVWIYISSAVASDSQGYVAAVDESRNKHGHPSGTRQGSAGPDLYSPGETTGRDGYL